MSKENRRLSPAQRFAAFAITAILSCFIFSNAALAGDLDKAEVNSLDGLETRFFEHTYKKEDTEARLDRLEKLIYGEAKQGDQAQRLTDLVAALPKSDPGDPPANTASAAGSNNSAPAAANNNDSQQTADNAAGDQEDYPTVDAIEQTILGKSFKGVPIAKRLDQLELKVFKKASNDPDLSERVSKLSDYVQKHMHKSIDQLVDPRTVLNYQSNGNADDSEPARAPAYTGSPGGSYGGGSYGAGNYGGAGGYSGGGSGSYGMNPPQPAAAYQQPAVNAPELAQVGWLEQRVFGREESPNVPLIDRLHKLEQTVFPTEQMDANAPIAGQIKLLVNAVELMHNSTPAPAAASGYGAYPAQQYQQPAANQYPYQQSAGGAAAGSNFPSWPPKGYASSATTTEYSGYSANAGQQPGTYPYQNAPGTDANTSQYEQQMNQQIQQPAQQQQQQEQQKQGHPLLKGLAHALMSAGAMAAPMMMMGGMNSMMGGYGGGYGGYGGGYGGYGGGMMGMPGYGGLGGLHF